MKPVFLAKTVAVQVQSAQITGLTATLDDGTTIPVSGPVSVGDWAVEDTTSTVVSVLAAKTYASELALAASITGASGQSAAAGATGAAS
ncbi:hypothetical protein [Methylomonas sp. AM2-LC]|uniref:hypothetical protein n=1 Tax=Methylomonas sp. AM2-LC TaxID=3153301 RepID=UPI0032636930